MKESRRFYCYYLNSRDFARAFLLHLSWLKEGSDCQVSQTSGLRPLMNRLLASSLDQFIVGPTVEETLEKRLSFGVAVLPKC